MKRYEKNPISKSSIKKTYDEKYGHYDYSKDARFVISELFKNEFELFTKEILKKSSKLVITGVNDGYEVGIIKNINKNCEIIGVDLSETALGRLKDNHNINGVLGDMQELPFSNESFDVYISLRAIHSSSIELNKAIDEAKRVTKKGGEIILSVSNGYLENGKIIKGMYCYDKKGIDKDKPYQIVEQIKKNLDVVKTHEIESEIFVLAINK